MGLRDRFRWVQGHWGSVVRPALVFEFWSTLLFVVLFLPAVGWLLNRLVARSGQVAVSDTAILTFLVSPAGVAFLLLSVGFALTFWFAEQAALMIIGVHAMRGEKVSVSRLLLVHVKHLPALLRLGLRQAVAYLLAALPFLAGIGLTHRLLLNEWDFYYYLNVQPGNWWIALAIVGLLLALYLMLAAWLYVRWLLSIPALLFERVAPRIASRSSWQRTRGRFRELAAPLAAGWLVVLLLSAGTTWLVGTVAAGVLSGTGSLAVLIPAVLATLGLLALLDLLWLVVGKILHVMLMTGAYQQAAGPDHAAVQADAAADRALPMGRIRAAWAVALVGLSVAGLAAGRGILQRFDVERNPGITGHRGSKLRAPENTLAALKDAMDQGADFAEIDVQTTADGIVVLLHDADLMRVASHEGHLNQLTYNELAGVEVGSWFDARFQGEPIPTLQQAMDLVRGRLKLNIELKYTWEDPQLAEKVGLLIKKNDFASQCVVSSLNFEALTEFRRAFPEVTTGFIVFQAVGNLARMEADFLSISAARARPGLVQAAHRRGRDVHVWTVNDRVNTLSMIEIGVDNIITDEPLLIRSLLEEWNGLSGKEKLTLYLRNLIVGFDAPPPSDL